MKNRYQQQTLDTNVTTSDKFRAEIIWILYSLCKGYSNNSAQRINETSGAMFTDSPTAQQFQLGHVVYEQLGNCFLL